MIVLYQEPIMVWNQLVTRLEWGALLVTVISLVVFFFSICFDGNADLKYIFGIFLVVGFVLFVLIIPLYGENSKVYSGRNRYEVYYPENNAYDVLTQKYIIKEQRGLIWVIEDADK